MKDMKFKRVFKECSCCKGGGHYYYAIEVLKSHGEMVFSEDKLSFMLGHLSDFRRPKNQKRRISQKEKNSRRKSYAIRIARKMRLCHKA